MKQFRFLALGYGLILGLTLLAAQLGSRAVTVMAEHRPLPRQHTIVIDAGHGGVDGGAVSCTGVPESRFNLEIARKLEDFLQFLGHKTVMIRRNDVSIHTKGETIAAKKASDLKERLRIARETENPVYLSIHQNFFPDSRYSGPQVFYAGTEGSRELAQALQITLTRQLSPESRRQAKQASGVYLMDHLSCTGVLVECGFLSNPREEALLRDPAYQKKLCAVLGCGLTEFLANT